MSMSRERFSGSLANRNVTSPKSRTSHTATINFYTLTDNPPLRIMPPTRRKSAAPSQQTLAFGPRSKVTKPSAPPTTAAKKASQGPSHAPPVIKALSETSSRASLKSTSEEESEPERPLTPTNHGDETGLLLKSPGGTLAIRQARVEPTKLEKQALQIGDGELKKYWLRTEDERKAKAGALIKLSIPSLKPRLMPMMNFSPSRRSFLGREDFATLRSFESIRSQPLSIPLSQQDPWLTTTGI